MKTQINRNIGNNTSTLEAQMKSLPMSIQTLLSCLDEPLIVLDAGLRVVYINENAETIGRLAHGFSYHTGDYISDLLPDDRKAPVLDYFQQAFKGQEVKYEIEIPVDGDSMWISCCYRPLFDGEEITGICVLLKDNTHAKKSAGEEEKRRAEEGRKAESKLLFEMFMHGTPLTAWITDENGTMRYLSPAFRKVFHIPFDQETRNLYDIFPKKFADEYRENDRAAIEAGKMIEVLERTPKEDGSIAIFRVFKFPMQVRGEQMTGGWAVEITEEVQLQEQLTNSIERYTYVHEATSDAIYDWDVATNKIYRGKGFAILFGFHNPYVSLDFRLSRIHPGDLPVVKKLYMESLADPSVKKWNIEFRFKDKNGHYRTVKDKAFIMREGGKAIRVIGALQDITEYKHLQEKILRSEESKKRAIVRSIIETQEKERRGLSVELHDNVNQILSSCKLMLEVAKDNKDKSQALTEKSYESLQLAIAEIRKISHELNPSSVVDFGLEEAISEMIENIHLSGKLDIRFKFEDHLKKAELKSEDKIAIYRIVQEQLNNILKHAKASLVSIEIQLQPSQVHLTIQDDGVGFNPRKVNKGIGLKNIYHRVEYYHGKMEVKTARNKGCRMVISLNIAANK